MFKRFACLVFVLLFPLTATAQPLGENVPDDALIYIAWRGSDEMGRGYEGSHVKAIIEASNLREVFNDFLPKFMERMAKEDPMSAEPLKILSAIGGPMWRHSSAFYFGGIEMAGGQPAPRISLYCDAGTDAPALVTELNKL